MAVWVSADDSEGRCRGSFVDGNEGRCRWQ